MTLPLLRLDRIVPKADVKNILNTGLQDYHLKSKNEVQWNKDSSFVGHQLLYLGFGCSFKTSGKNPRTFKK